MEEHSNYQCPVSATVGIIGGRWKPIIIWVLMNGGKRFGQLHAIIGDISRKILTEQLRELETQDLIIRTEYKELPPRVVYELSEKGETLRPIIMAMHNWGNQNLAAKGGSNENFSSSRSILS
jgi:DNA-binding HxlR family transcriptional regulator